MRRNQWHHISLLLEKTHIKFARKKRSGWYHQHTAKALNYYNYFLFACDGSLISINQLKEKLKMQRKSTLNLKYFPLLQLFCNLIACRNNKMPTTSVNIKQMHVDFQLRKMCMASTRFSIYYIIIFHHLLTCHKILISCNWNIILFLSLTIVST